MPRVHAPKSRKELIDVIRHREFAYGLLFVLAVFAVIFYFEAIVSIAAFFVLLILASVSTSYKRKMGIPLGGVELVTFGTVVTGIAFGPVVGLVFGVVSALASEIISANIGPVTWIYAFSMGISGFFAGIFGSLNIVLLGMAATLFNLLLNQGLNFAFGDEELQSMTIFYVIVNIAFNLALFLTLGSRVLGILM